MTVESHAETRRAGDFLLGMRASVPVIVAAAPFGLLFGALAVENGFTTFEAVLMSATIFGGASQMVGIDLFGRQVAPWLIVLSIFAVNFRHVLYSATIGRYIGHWTPLQRWVGFFFLVDPQFAEVERRVEQVRPLTFAWYMGVAVPVFVAWVSLSGLGALFGRLIEDPHALGLDFLLPIYFLGLVMGFRRRAGWLSVVLVSALASILAHQTVGSPWHVTIGALAGVFFAALSAPGTTREAGRP